MQWNQNSQMEIIFFQIRFYLFFLKRSITSYKNYVSGTVARLSTTTKGLKWKFPLFCISFCIHVLFGMDISLYLTINGYPGSSYGPVCNFQIAFASSPVNSSTLQRIGTSQVDLDQVHNLILKREKINQVDL